MKNRYKYLVGVAIVGVSALFGGCQKNFLDINVDPKSPIDLPLTQILPAAEGGLAFNLSMNVGGLNSATSTFSHQIVNSRVNNYIIDGTTFQTPWSGSGSTYGFYSGVLNDLQTVITKGTTQNAPHYVGVAQVQKAYLFSILVDLFGDVPYFDALKGNDNLNPKYDGSAAIYDDLFKLLDNAIVNLGATSSTFSPDASTDFIYSGDRTKWIKLANTIKLKLYNQIRLKQNVTAQINALITGGNLITNAVEDFQIRFGTSSAPENRNPGFFANYNSAGARESFVSPYFYTLLKSSVDPRLPYYVYNQLTPTNSPSNPTDFRDGRFVSVRFASKGPNATFDQRLFQSLIGLFPVGGRYDDGLGGTGTLTNGPSDGPLRLLTNYHVKFILAESALMSGTNGSAVTLLEEGMRLHFAKVNAQAAAVPSSVQSVPQISSLAIDAYVSTIVGQFNVASTADKLKIIITQKWISSFGYGIDSYTDYRRTGYPVIPVTDGSVDPVMVSTRTFPFRLTYPNSEVTSNTSFPGQPDPYTTKIFWSN